MPEKTMKNLNVVRKSATVLNKYLKKHINKILMRFQQLYKNYK